MDQIPIKYHKQETDVYCAPAIVQMILDTYGIEAGQSELADSMETDSHGTPILALQNCLIEQGFTSKLKNNASWEDLEDALGAGNMVVVGYVEHEEVVGHYALIETVLNVEIILADPWHGAHYRIRREDFERNWKDDEDGAYGERMMLAVTPPKGM